MFSFGCLHIGGTLIWLYSTLLLNKNLGDACMVAVDKWCDYMYMYNSLYFPDL